MKTGGTGSVDAADGPEVGGGATYVVRHSRRLSDKVLAAFHHACDLGDFEIADRLLQVLESMTTRKSRAEDGSRRRNIQSLVAAHERLWHLRHPATD